MKKNKNKIMISFIMILLFLSIAYAILQANLEITGLKICFMSETQIACYPWSIIKLGRGIYSSFSMYC